MTQPALRILVTSGGTSEPIDQVRRITNTSTGRLGSLIADAFAQAGAEVTYLCGENAALPTAPMAEIRTIGSVEDLGIALDQLLAGQRFDCMVHAMAVSDYTTRRVTTAEDLARSVAAVLRQESEIPGEERLTQMIRDSIRQQDNATAGKLSSNLEDMVLLLGKTPKVISRVKAQQPEMLLVGFKLLVDVSEQELERVARELLVRNRCDFVLANDLQKIHGDAHAALLVSREGILRRMSTKVEIAREIMDCVTEKAKGQGE